MGAGGLMPLHVARSRDTISGELGAEVGVPVVDVRLLSGVCLTYAPCDLLRVAVKGTVGP
jgi:hypothetical protein